METVTQFMHDRHMATNSIQYLAVILQQMSERLEWTRAPLQPCGKIEMRF
jgi:hypothetical protein